MNREDFERRYELIERVTEGDIESHHALHRSGVVVMVHFVSGTEDLRARVALAAERLRTVEGDNLVLETHQLDDRLLIVTRFLRDFESLEAWLAGRGHPVSGAAAAPEPEVADPRDPPSGEQVGEFTRMFLAGGAGAPGDEPGAPDAPGASPPEGAEPSGAGGEFTRMFMAGGADELGEDPRAPTELPVPAREGQEPSEPVGEFTRMFMAAGPDREGPTPAADSPPVSSAGERDAQDGPHEVEHADSARKREATPPPAAEQGAPEGTGEFTRMFRASGTAEEGVAPGRPDAGSSAGTRPADSFAPPPKVETGEFTQFFRGAQEEDTPSLDQPSLDWSDAPIAGRHREPEAPPTPSADTDWAEALRAEPSRKPHRPAPRPADPGKAGTGQAGEFTQIFGAAVPPRPPRPGPAPSPPEAPDPSKGAATPPSPPVPRPSPASVGRKPAVPDAEALLGRGRPRMPRPPRFRAPGELVPPRVDARTAARAGMAAMGRDDSDRAAQPEKAGNRSRMSSTTFAIALVVLLVVTVGMVAFFALWDFEGSAAGGDAPVGDSIVAGPSGAEG